MGQARDEAGNLWETDAQGNPIRLLQAAGAPAAAPGGQIFSLPMSAKDIAAEQRQRTADARAASADQRAAGADARAAEAAARAQREWDATHNPDGSPKKTAAGGKPMPDGAAKRLEEAVNAFASLDRAVGGFQDDFAGNTITGELENKAQNLIGTGTPGQAQWWADFRATDNILRNALFGASLTAGEKAAYEATSIKPNMDPAQVRANLTRRMELARGTLQRRMDFLKHNGYNPEAVDALAGEYGDIISGKAKQRAENELPDPSTGAQLKPPPNDPSPPDAPPPPNDPDRAIATGNMKDDYSARLSAQVDALINNGASQATINAVLQKAGFPTINAGDLARAKRWMKENPGQRYSGARVTRPQQTSFLERAASSPLAAAIAQSANAATAGTVGAMAGEEGQGALDAMSQLHPKSSLAGGVVGGVAGAMGAEAALAARAPTFLAPFAPRAADALYGGVSGFNAAQDGEGLQGAATGAGAGLLGGLIGQRVARGLGRTLTGVTDPAVQALRARGIPLTIGQTLANSGRIGSTVKSIEDGLTSFPGIGNIVNARRREGMEGFNQAAFREMPGHSGTTGAEGIREGADVVDDAYSFLNTTDLPLDAPYAGTEAMIRNTAPNRFAADIGDQLDQTAERVVNGNLPGRDWQSAVRANRTNRSSLAGQPYADPAVASHNAIEDNLMGLAQRQGPPGTVEDLATANALNGQYQTLVRALDNGPAQQADELFTPMRLDAAARQGANAFGGRASSIAGNRPFYDLTQAGRQVLPSQVPDSGTVTRGLVGAGVLGGGGAAVGAGGGALAGDPQTGAGLGLGTVLLLAAGGNRPAQRLATSILARRPDALTRAGQRFLDNSGVGGWTGAGLLTPLLVGP